MVLLWATLLVTMIVAAECQVVFPTDFDCIASNMYRGNCYEFRSNELKECSYFPSTNTSYPEVEKHLEANVCRNTGKEIYFCCPSNTKEASILTPKEECPVSLSFNVVGGDLTDRGTFPWLAALGKKDVDFVPFCGGILITKQYVLTAAHCFNQIPTNRTTVRLGEHNWQKPEGGEQDFDIIDNRKKNYNRKTKENDIILLKLETPVKLFTDNIKAACLPYQLRNNSFEEKNLTVVGWGAFNNSRRSQPAPVPLQGNVPVVPIAECQQKYEKKTNGNSIIDNSQLCAGTGFTDSCNGDSGGPIHYLDLDSGRFIVVGIVSFGPILCGHDSLPGVYTRIDQYLNWIEDSIRDMEK